MGWIFECVDGIDWELDNNEITVAGLNSGVSNIEGLDSKSLKKLIANNKIFFSKDFSQISNS